MDNHLQALENLDADDIERLRQRRMDQMKQAATKKQACLCCVMLARA